MFPWQAREISKSNYAKAGQEKKRENRLYAAIKNQLDCLKKITTHRPKPTYDIALSKLLNFMIKMQQMLINLYIL